MFSRRGGFVTRPGFPASGWVGRVEKPSPTRKCLKKSTKGGSLISRNNLGYSTSSFVQNQILFLRNLSTYSSMLNFFRKARNFSWRCLGRGELIISTSLHFHTAFAVLKCWIKLRNVMGPMPSKTPKGKW